MNAPQFENISSESSQALLHILSELLPSLDEFANYQGQRQLLLPDIEAGDQHETIEHLKTIASQSTFLVRGCCEHLASFILSTKSRQMSIAPFSCMRSALESAALATWITDQKVSRKDRIARSFSLRYEGLKHQKGYADSVQSAHSTTVAARIQKVEADATAMGYPAFRHPKDHNKIVDIGCRWLGSTETIKVALGMSEEYRLLSSVTHGHTWATIALGYKEATKPGFLERDLHPLALTWLCITGARCISISLWNTCEFLGTPSASTRNILNSMYDQMKIEDQRVWA